MWCGNKEGGSDHTKNREKTRIYNTLSETHVLSPHEVGTWFDSDNQINKSNLIGTLDGNYWNFTKYIGGNNRPIWNYKQARWCLVDVNKASLSHQKTLAR
jgi:hypothetical protein